MLNIIGFVALFVGLLIGIAQANDLVEYESHTQNDGTTITRNYIRSEVVGVRFSSGTRRYRNFFSNYDGKAIITVKVTRLDNTTYNREIDTWFDEADEAHAFVTMMNGSTNLDLYYDFLNSPVNSESKWEECGAIHLYCRRNPATIVNRHRITADKLWVHNRITDRMVKVMPEMEERGLVSDNTRIFDGNRDSSNPDGGQNTEERDSNRAASV